jgi:hypothetical protein
MPDFAPVSLRVVDNNGKVLIDTSVPFSPNITARKVFENAFILAQTAQNPDPVVFTLQYYGYSEAPQFPGYLGYEIESIDALANTAQFYWDLIVDGVTSQNGADTSYPNPGGSVLWQYTPIPVAPAVSNRRATLIQRRQTKP